MACIAGAFRTAQHAAVCTIEPIKRVLYDWDEALNISSLCLKISEISGILFGVRLPDAARSSFSAFCELSGARNIFKRSYELISGDAAWEMEGKTRIPAPWVCRSLRCASKLASMVGDVCSLGKWLANCHFIDQRLFEVTGHIGVLGRSIKVVQGVKDAAGFLSAAFMVPTNIVALVESVSHLGLNGLFRRTYLFDLAQDIIKIAAIVLMNIPGVPPIYPAVTMTVGCIISLARFVKKNYFSDPEGRDRPRLADSREELIMDAMIPQTLPRAATATATSS